MKVLAAGRKQKGWATTTKCTGTGNGGCGAKLLVEERDLFLTESHARDETTTYITFQCSACGVKTDLVSTDNYGSKHSVLFNKNFPSERAWLRAQEEDD